MAQAIYEELIVMDLNAKDDKDVIQKFGALFEENGFVKDSYVAAVMQREDEYPTGLQLADMAIAMPHTTGTHVNKPAVGVARLKNPVTFAHMGDAETKVQAELIFMMAILNPSDQMDLLQRVMRAFTNAESAAQFKSARTKEELYEVAKKYIDI